MDVMSLKLDGTLQCCSGAVERLALICGLASAPQLFWNGNAGTPSICDTTQHVSHSSPYSRLGG